MTITSLGVWVDSDGDPVDLYTNRDQAKINVTHVDNGRSRLLV